MSKDQKREKSGVRCFGCEELFLDEGHIVFFFWDEEGVLPKDFSFPSNE